MRERARAAAAQHHADATDPASRRAIRATSPRGSASGRDRRTRSPARAPRSSRPARPTPARTPKPTRSAPRRRASLHARRAPAPTPSCLARGTRRPRRRRARDRRARCRTRPRPLGRSAAAADQDHLVVVELAALDERRELARRRPPRPGLGAASPLAVAPRAGVTAPRPCPTRTAPGSARRRARAAARRRRAARSAIVTGRARRVARDRAARLQLGAQHAREAERRAPAPSAAAPRSCAVSIRSSSLSRSARTDALRAESLSSASSPSTAPRVSVLIACGLRRRSCTTSRWPTRTTYTRVRAARPRGTATRRGAGCTSLGERGDLARASARDSPAKTVRRCAGTRRRSAARRRRARPRTRRGCGSCGAQRLRRAGVPVDRRRAPRRRRRSSCVVRAPRRGEAGDRAGEEAAAGEQPAVLEGVQRVRRRWACRGSRSAPRRRAPRRAGARPSSATWRPRSAAPGTEPTAAPLSVGNVRPAPTPRITMPGQPLAEEVRRARRACVAKKAIPPAHTSAPGTTTARCPTRRRRGSPGPRRRSR